MKRYSSATFIIALASIIISTACQKVDVKPLTSLKIRLTNHITTAQEVNLDVKAVSVNLENDTTWIPLRVNTGIYNLLSYLNGTDTLIAAGNVPATKIVNQMRITLGDNNTIKINKQAVPLSVSSGNNILNATIAAKMNKDIEIVVVDFDAASSIYQTASGKFEIRPVLNVKAIQ